MSGPAQAGPVPGEDARSRRVELIISGLLRTGVLASLAVVLAGTLLSFLHHPGYGRSPAALAPLLAPGAAFPHSLAGVLDGVLRLHGAAWVAAGLLLLIATPVLRVAVSVLAFAVERDRVFVAITCVVLALLLFSFALGQAAG